MMYKVITFLLFICISTLLKAESLIDIYQQALKNDNTLKSAHFTYLIEQENKYIERAKLLPQISLEGTLTRSESNSLITSKNPFAINNEQTTGTDSKGYTISLTQPLLNLSSIKDFQRAKLSGFRAKIELENEKQKLIIRVTDIYLQILKAKANYSTLLETKEAFQQQLKYVKENYLIGIARVSEVQEVRSFLDLAIADVISAKSNVDILFKSLKTITGQDYQHLTQLLPKKFSPKKPTPRDVGLWVEAANQNNLDIKVANYRKQEAKKFAESKKAKHLPTLHGRLTYRDAHDDNTYNHLIPNTINQDQWSASIVLTVPIYSGGSHSATYRMAKYRHYQQQDIYNQEKLELNNNVHTNYLNLMSSIALLDASDTAIKSNETSLKSVRSEYRLGIGNLTDLLNAQRSLNEAKQRYFESLYTYLIAGFKLKKIAGVISVDDVLELTNALER